MSGKNAIQQFSNADLGATIRVIEQDGEPWFVAKDVAAALGYAESSNAARLFANVPEDWRGVNPFHTHGGTQEMLCLTEQGLYFFLGRSDKPGALPFQKWLAGEVLPSIRKHGAYVTDSVLDRVIKDPQSIIALAEALVLERDRRELAEERLDVFKPRTRFGTPSNVNGRPRVNPVSGYFRTTKTTTTTTEITEHQRRLFDFDGDDGKDTFYPVASHS